MIERAKWPWEEVEQAPVEKVEFVLEETYFCGVCERYYPYDFLKADGETFGSHENPNDNFRGCRGAGNKPAHKKMQMVVRRK